MRPFAVFLCLILLAASGCNSIRTTFLEQDSCGNLVKNPEHCRKGLPVMLEVPTHVEVKIVQTDYWQVKGEANAEKQLVFLAEASSRRPVITDIFTEQMFLVDPKRPAEGEGQFKFQFNNLDDNGKDNGTLSGVQYKAVDKTFSASAGLLTTALGVLGTPTAARSGAKVLMNERTIALRRFPRGTECESEIADFIAQYIDNCADQSCTQSPAYALPAAASH